MALHTDRDDRSREILTVAISLLHSGGYGAVTVRAIAEELGGSVTLVTHYFPTQAGLMKAMLELILEQFDEELAQLESGASDLERLRILIDWFLPSDEASWYQERARVHLVSELGFSNEWVRPYLDRLEERMTQLLRRHLEPLLIPADLEVCTDAVRLAVNGVVLSSIEHPDDWPPDRQREIAGFLIRSLPLREASSAPAP